MMRDGPVITKIPVECLAGARIDIVVAPFDSVLRPPNYLLTYMFYFARLVPVTPGRIPPFATVDLIL